MSSLIDCGKHMSGKYFQDNIKQSEYYKVPFSDNCVEIKAKKSNTTHRKIKRRKTVSTTLIRTSNTYTF